VTGTRPRERSRVLPRTPKRRRDLARQVVLGGSRPVSRSVPSRSRLTDRPYGQPAPGASSDDNPGNLSRMACVQVLMRRRFRIGWVPSTAVIAALGSAGCSGSAAATPPAGYLQLHLARTSVVRTVAVGAKLAVHDIPGNSNSPVSEEPTVVESSHWASSDRGLRHWYPFTAVSVGQALILEALPCKGTACSAAAEAILVTVTPRK